MDITEMLYEAFEGNAVLFLGSGFSIGAKKGNGSKFETAKPLAHKLLAECGYEKKDFRDDLGIAAEIYLEDKGASILLDFLRTEFTAVDVEDCHRKVASVPWKRVYTTNYDNVFELATTLVGRSMNSVLMSDKKKNIRNKHNLCLHINGSVSRLTEEKLNDEFKLTDKSYMVESFVRNEWFPFFRSDLESASVIVFIGYSLEYDLDIKRILNSVSDKEETFFVIWDETPEIDKRLLSKYGHVLPINTKGFAEEIEKAKSEYDKAPAVKKAVNFRCFSQIGKYPDPPELKLDDEFNLFLKGETEPSKLLYSVLNTSMYPYVIKRNSLDIVLRKIEQKEKRILIHSDFGNGKSVFMECLGLSLSHKGYSVFRYDKDAPTLQHEIENICSIDSKVVIMADDYYSCPELTKILHNHLTDQILIFSERSATNDISYCDLTNDYEDFMLIDLNRLNREECHQLSALLEHHGCWGDLSNVGESERQLFIANKCDSQLKSVILKLLNSPNMLKKFESIINAIRSRDEYYEAIMLILISNVAHLKLDISELAFNIGLQTINSAGFQRNPVVREFIDFENNTIKVKSSLVSNVIFQKILDAESVADMLLSIFKRIDSLPEGKERNRILKELMRFGNVQRILNQKSDSFKECIQNYYNQLKKLSYCRKNPLFWLQCSMLKISERDYVQSRKYLETAYSYADNNFDTFQLDNQYARNILENEIYHGNRKTAMSAFVEAHSILTNPSRQNESRYYPYKVSRNYGPFYDRFFTELDQMEKKYFLDSCLVMLRKVVEYLNNSTGNQHRREVLMAKDILIRVCKENSMPYAEIVHNLHSY